MIRSDTDELAVFFVQLDGIKVSMATVYTVHSPQLGVRRRRRARYAHQARLELVPQEINDGEQTQERNGIGRGQGLRLGKRRGCWSHR